MTTSIWCYTHEVRHGKVDHFDSRRISVTVVCDRETEDPGNGRQGPEDASYSALVTNLFIVVCIGFLIRFLILVHYFLGGIYCLDTPSHTPASDLVSHHTGKRTLSGIHQVACVDLCHITSQGSAHTADCRYPFLIGIFKERYLRIEGIYGIDEDIRIAR